MAETKRVRRGGPPGGGPPGMRPGDKPKNFKKTMGKLIRSMRPFYLRIVIVMLFSAVSSVLSIIGPKILGNATTEIADGLVARYAGTGGVDFAKIGGILLTLLYLYLISLVFSTVQGFLMAKVAEKTAFTFRTKMAEKINKLPLSYFDKQTTGEVLSRVTNDADTIGSTLGQGLSQMVTAITTVVGVIIMMFSINTVMALVSLAIAPLSLIIVGTVVGISQKHFKLQQEYLGHINGKVEESYAGVVILKAFNAEGKTIEAFDELNNTLYKSAWKSQAMSGAMMPLINFVGNLGYVAVCVAGSLLAVKKAIEVGDIMSFIQYVRMYTQPLSNFAQIMNITQSTAAAAERVFEFLEESEETPDTVPSASPENVKGVIKFNNIKFGYSPDKVVINNFSAEILPGQRVAIVGPTGAGKTTIVKLLMRFYEPLEGSVTIDGTDIRNFKRHDLRGMVSMVLQDAWLFNGTIKENVGYGKLTATDEEIKAAGKSAHIEHFVKTLPGAYDMVLNEEAANISQGQKQLLTIARAILTDPKILILDEATSSVDTRTEVRIQKAMNNLMRGRTCFIIAHRLSTIRDADWILVMNNGDIAEQGTHEQLLEKGGFYSELYNAQFESGLTG
ncbi:MAG: ABC transporter ATP-binding protein/permease [Clostridiales bacterium]|jgi:ATP-binding cassette subfamily B protein|nr:ABC transporter ATP-binding protein/permease [Clostridiales bacterium]